MSKKFYTLVSLCFGVAIQMAAQVHLSEQVSKTLSSSSHIKKMEVSQSEREARKAPPVSDIPREKEIQVTDKPVFTLQDRRFESDSLLSAPLKSQMNKSDNAPTNLQGDYILKYTSFFDEDKLNYYNINLTPNEAGGYNINNFWGFETPLTAVYDAASAVITIPAQKIYVHSTYGDVYFCPVDEATNKYNPAGDVTGVISKNGDIMLASWGLFVIEGDYKGASYDVGLNSGFFLPNALIQSIQETDTLYYKSYMHQVSDNQMIASNIAGNGKAVRIDLYADKSLSISPQYIFTNLFYGEFYCYPANWAISSSAQKGSINGTGSVNEFNFGNWGVFCRLANYFSAMKVESMKITTTLDISYPKALTQTFSGEGTQTSPYLIKTIEDLQYMAQALKEGNTYKDRYFLLNNDIDFSSYTGVYRKIGLSPEMPFEGNFNGNNKTVTGFTLNGHGDDYLGFFGVIGKSGCVSNLNFSKAKISVTGSSVGVVVGRSLGPVENCHVSGSLVVKNNIVGGIAGYSAETIKNCSFKGTISAYGNIGGISGMSYGSLAGCRVQGMLSMSGILSDMYASVGGIAGISAGISDTKVSISDCAVSGSLEDATGYATMGGIVGMSVSSVISRCFNVAEIYTKASENGSVGGLFGSIYTTDVSDCFNAGSVLGTDALARIGGLVGNVTKSEIHSGGTVTVLRSSIRNCYNTGIVKSTVSDYVNNLYGETYEEAVFSNCYYDHQVTGVVKQLGAVGTSQLTGNVILDGFSPDIWVFAEDRYPALKGLHETAASLLATSPMLLHANDNIGNVKHNFRVISGNGVIWKIYSGNTFVDETAGMKINGSDVLLQGGYSSQLLCAIGDGGICRRLYYVSVVPKVFDGEGTADDPFLIKTKEDFVKLDEAVSVYKQQHAGDYFKMAGDIDMSGLSGFTGVGSKSSASGFGGVFDGAGYSIHNLNISAVSYDEAGTAVPASSYICTGLFGLITETSEIRNVTIASDCEFSFWAYGAPIVGASFGKIENCKNYAPVKSVYNYTGGIAGAVYDAGSIINCYNAGDIVGGSTYIGGIVGFNMNKVTNCQNDGRVMGEFVNAYVKKGNQNYVGGICGLNYGEISNCCNTAFVSAYSTVGGLIGYNSNYYGSSIVVSNLNTGLVACLNDVLTRGAVIGQFVSVKEIADNYYDMQLNVYGGVNNVTMAGVIGLTAGILVSGTPVPGLHSENWSYVQAAYPVLDAYAKEAKSVISRRIYACFDENDMRTNVRKEILLSVNEGLIWDLALKNNFTIESGKVQVVIPTEQVLACDTLIARYDDYVKRIPLSAIPEILKGNGTASSPFLIESVEDMNKLATFISSSKVDYSGSHFLLVNDLDYADQPYLIISSGTNKFQGTFNGNDKTISNLRFSSITTTDKYVALFGSVGESGTVKNLTLAANSSIEGHSYVAGFAGKLYGILDNCINKAVIKASKGSYAAGLVAVGYTGAQIVNSANYGAISSTGSYVGGIAGLVNADTYIGKCVNYGTVSGTGILGGIAGKSAGTIGESSNIADQNNGGIGAIAYTGYRIIGCYNTANIVSTATASGIVCTLSSGVGAEITGCHNSGNVSGAGSVAGILSTATAGVRIADCYNTGEISSSKTTCGGVAGTLSGSVSAPTYVENCYNTGLVTGTGDNFGGFASRINSNVFVSDCYNLGDVVVTGKYTGGFAGSCGGNAIRCFNAGDVASTGLAAAGFASLGAGNANKCFNVGNVTSDQGVGNEKGTFSNAGGFWGYGKPIISNSFNFGNVSGPDYLGGFIGQCYTDIQVTNCYAVAEITSSSTYSKVGAFTTPYGTVNTGFDNNYYDVGKNSLVFVHDHKKYAAGYTKKHLTALDLGEEYVNQVATYPLLADFMDNPYANFAAAAIVFADQDTESNVTAEFLVGTPAGIVWEASDHLVIDGNNVIPVAEGSAWLRKSVGPLSKTYNLEVTKTTTSLNLNTDGKVCVQRVYYDIHGRQTSSLQASGIYIEECTFEDGSKLVRKKVVK